MLVSLDDIERARTTIRGLAVRTPLIHAHALGHLVGAEVYLKPEMLQRAGSFKIRGALNRIAQLTPVQKDLGVIAASAGNHAQGVAMAALRMRMPATIVMPVLAPHTKAEATRAYGATVIRHGSSYHDAQEHARQLASERGLTLIHAFDDPYVVAGQGTIGLEIVDELPIFDDIIVPVGGGGLIAGISIAVRPRNPTARIVGVQSELAPAAARSLEAGQPLTVAPGPTIADGIRIERPGDLPFAVIRELVDTIVTVSEDDLRNAIALLAQRAKLVAEAAGAAPLAAILSGAVGIEGRTVVLVLSGGNIDLERLGPILSQVGSTSND